MSYSDRQSFLAVFGVLLAIWASFLYGYKSPPTGRAAHASHSADADSVPKSLEDILTRRVVPEAKAAKLHDWALAARERVDSKKYKDDANIAGDLARVLLESAQGSRPPSAEQLAEGRRMAELAAMRGGRKSSAARASKLALLLAEGQFEEALSVANDLLAVTHRWPSYASATYAYLAASCAKACKARRQEQLMQHAPEGTVFKEPPERAAGSERAAAMWRIMEAGRTAAKGAELEPENKEAQAWKHATRKLVELDAFRVSSSAELFELGGCEAFVGLKLDGTKCPPDGDNPYVKKGKGKGKKKATSK